MHDAAFRYVARVVADLPRPQRVVEIGSRNVNGTPRSLFAGVESYTGIDVRPGDGVDVVADGATWQPDEPVDLVVCMEVLEHAPEAGEIVANACRMLRPGGTLILTAAGEGRAPHSASDGGPLQAGEFYRNVSADDLRQWARAFETCDVETGRGDVYATCRKGAACG